MDLTVSFVLSAVTVAIIKALTDSDDADNSVVTRRRFSIAASK